MCIAPASLAVNVDWHIFRNKIDLFRLESQQKHCHCRMGWRCKECTLVLIFVNVDIAFCVIKIFLIFPLSIFYSAVWRSQHTREGTRLQRGALRFHPVPHQAILLTVYPFNAYSNCNSITMVILFITLTVETGMGHASRFLYGQWVFMSLPQQLLP